MSFDEKLLEAIDKIDVPEELSPANIEAMLRASGVSPAPAKQTDEEKSQNTRTMTISVTGARRSVIIRTLTAAAACAALAAGLRAIGTEQTRDTEPIDSRIEYKAVQVESYDELYNIYTGIYSRSSEAVGAENGDGKEIITDETGTGSAFTTVNTAPPAQTEFVTSEPIPDGTAVTTAPTNDDRTSPVTEVSAPSLPSEAVTEPVRPRSDLSEADIVKSDDRSVYYISGKKLYAVDKDDMTLKAEISCKNTPLEMYVKGSVLVLISEETAEGSQAAANYVCADIYDISTGTPEYVTEFMQNGCLTSVRLDRSGVLYLVTGYSDYRKTPLYGNDELESYVPGYYIDGVKYYVAAEDISVPVDATNTDYTVVSSVCCNNTGADVSVKAVLGGSANVFCSDSTLYVAGTGVKDGKVYTAVTSFSLSESGLEYKASASLDGELISRYSMAETEGLFRIAARSYNDNGTVVTDIYSLDSSLNAISVSKDLLPGVMVGSVTFEGANASLFERGLELPSLTVNMNESTSPDEAFSEGEQFAPYLNDIGGGCSAGLTKNNDNSSLILELYDPDGKRIGEVSFAQLLEVDSPALTDRKAMLTDSTYNIIGVPVTGYSDFGKVSQYYVFGYDPVMGLEQKGVIEFNDMAENYCFERAVINGNSLIIIGSGRMVSVDLTDMTVTDTVDFN